MTAENGAVPTPAPDEGTITITLILKPTAFGYQLNVSAAPTTVYPEAIIEACQRAAQFYKDQMAAHATIQMLDQIRRVREQSQRIMRG
jgi:hypothetical protein